MNNKVLFFLFFLLVFIPFHSHRIHHLNHKLLILNHILNTETCFCCCWHQFFFLRFKVRTTFRTEFVSWWKEEEPSYLEYEKGLVNLEAANNKVNYILAHTCPKSISDEYINQHKQTMFVSLKDTSQPAAYFETICSNVEFDGFYFGHWHDNWNHNKFHMLYHRITQIPT